MTQRQIPHPLGTFAGCPRCFAQPRHTFDCRAPHAGGGHMLECCPCDNRTAKHPTLEKADADWRQRNGYAPVSAAQAVHFRRPLGVAR